MLSSISRLWRLAWHCQTSICLADDSVRLSAVEIKNDDKQAESPFDEMLVPLMLGNAQLIERANRLDLAREMLRDTYELRAAGKMTADQEHEIRRHLMFSIEHDQ
jgi:hypothetical protein